MSTKALKGGGFGDINLIVEEHEHILAQVEALWEHKLETWYITISKHQKIIKELRGYWEERIIA